MNNNEYEKNFYLADMKLAKTILKDSFASFKQFKEELIQEAVMKIWQYRRTQKNGEGDADYIFILAKNAMIDFLRKQARHLDNNISIFDELEEELEIFDTLEAELDREALERIEEMKYLILADRVQSVIAHYEKRDKKIIEMYLNRRSYDEISKYNRVSLGYVAKQVKQFRNDVSMWLGGRRAVA